MKARRPYTPNARIRDAIQTGHPDLPARFLRAYQRGGTPTALHLRLIADAAGTTPARLLTGTHTTGTP